MLIDKNGHIVFTAFESRDLTAIENLLLMDNNGKYELYYTKPDIENSIIPQRGGAHFPKAIFFKPIGTEFIIQYTNYYDGLITLASYISNQLDIPFYHFTFSNQAEFYKKYAFQRNEKGKIIRLVYALQDPKWTFYEQGEMLYFENLTNYTKKRIPDRINKIIILDYCEKLKLDITNNSFWTDSETALFYERKQW